MSPADPAATSGWRHRRRPRRVARTARLGVAVLATANLAMVAIMAVVPVQLHEHGHGLGVLGVVVSAHIGAMYAASPALGHLADRIGPRRLAMAGAAALAVIGLLPTVLDTDGLAGATTVLLLLGVGWNTQVVAGSALLGHDVAQADRVRLEARGEMAMSVGAGGGSLLLAGPLVAVGGLELLAAATAVLQLPLLAALHAHRPGEQP